MESVIVGKRSWSKNFVSFLRLAPQWNCLDEVTRLNDDTIIPSDGVQIKISVLPHGDTDIGFAFKSVRIFKYSHIFVNVFAEIGFFRRKKKTQFFRFLRYPWLEESYQIKILLSF